MPFNLQDDQPLFSTHKVMTSYTSTQVRFVNAYKNCTLADLAGILLQYWHIVWKHNRLIWNAWKNCSFGPSYPRCVDLASYTCYAIQMLLQITLSDTIFYEICDMFITASDVYISRWLHASEFLSVKIWMELLSMEAQRGHCRRGHCRVVWIKYV